MSASRFSWDQWDATLKTFLLEDNENGIFSDMKITCSNNEMLKVHKIVFAATSKLMADLLSSANDNLEEDVTIILPDFDVSTIQRHGLIFLIHLKILKYLKLLITTNLYSDFLMQCIKEGILRHWVLRKRMF